MEVNNIDPTRTAMIVVDMQNDFVAAGAPIETPAARAIPRAYGTSRGKPASVNAADETTTAIPNAAPDKVWQSVQ